MTIEFLQKAATSIYITAEPEVAEEISKLLLTAASELSALQKENAELKAANDYNDTDLPLDELMGGIDDAVMDFKPDCDSDSAGTLLERVQAAAELGREVASLRTQNRELRETLKEAKQRLYHSVYHADRSNGLTYEESNEHANNSGIFIDEALALQPEK